MAKRDYPFLEIEERENYSSGISTHVDWKPRANIIEAEDLVVVEIEIPGVDKIDVSILLEGHNELIIKGTKPQPRLDAPQVTYHLFEREFGSFYKRVHVDFPLDAQKISSVMDNGVLTIKLPRKKSQKISVDIK